MESLEVRTRFIELRAKGYSFDKIAAELGIAKKTLVTWSKQLDGQVQAAKALELEALLEKHYLLKEQQLETFGRLLKKIDDSLAIRDMAEVSTEKLLELRLKYQAATAEHLPAPVFLTEAEAAEEAEATELLDRLCGLQKPERA